MQEESRWRYGLAQQIASHAHANPKVAAVLVEGSVARGDADRFSDLDLAVFWAEPPTVQERRDIVIRAAGRDRRPWPPPKQPPASKRQTLPQTVATHLLHTPAPATH